MAGDHAKNISLLYEHNAFTCHFNIMNNITVVFCTIHGTIRISLKRQVSVANGSPNLHTSWQFYSGLKKLSMIFHILSAPLTTIGVDCNDCEIQTNVNALCSLRRDISLCMIL